MGASYVVPIKKHGNIFFLFTFRSGGDEEGEMRTKYKVGS
jgi:hypothetical protein